MSAMNKPSTQVKESNGVLHCGSAMVSLIDHQAMTVQAVHRLLADGSDINLYHAPIPSRSESPMKSTRLWSSRIDRVMPSLKGLKSQSWSGEAVGVPIDRNGLQRSLGSEEIAPKRPSPNSQAEPVTRIVNVKASQRWMSRQLCYLMAEKETHVGN